MNKISIPYYDSMLNDQTSLKVKVFKAMCAKCGISGIYLCADNKNIYTESADCSLISRRQCGMGNIIATYEISIDDLLKTSRFKDAKIMFNGDVLSSTYMNAFNIKTICFPHFLARKDINSYSGILHLSNDIMHSVCYNNLTSNDASILFKRFDSWNTELRYHRKPTPISILNKINTNTYKLYRNISNFIKIESDYDIAMFVDYLYLYFYSRYDLITIDRETSLTFQFNSSEDAMHPFKVIADELAPYLAQTIDGQKIFPDVHNKVLWKNSISQTFEEMLIEFDITHS